MSSDPLAEFWVHPVVIERYTASKGGYGTGYDEPQTVNGWVHDGTKLVTGADGAQVASSAQVALPATTAYVPVQSLVTLPDQFAAPGKTRQLKVIASARGDGGGAPTPDHLVLALE